MKLVENKAIISADKKEAFRFALEGDEDKVFELPMIQDLPARQVQKLSEAGDDKGTKELFDLLDTLTPGLLDVATQREVGEILSAWSDASQVSLGE
jgi:hypothetical protein